MIQYIAGISTLFSLFSIILKIWLFTFSFQPLYKNCDIRKKIKKGGKSKVISKPNIIIAFSYFILLFIMFRLFTFKMILFIAFGCVFGSLFAYDRFYGSSQTLEKYNKSPVMIFSWKIFSTIFYLIYALTNPINKIVYEYVQKKFNLLKKMATYITHLDSNSLGEKNLDDINKQLAELAEKNENSNMSGISEYVVKSSKNIKLKSHHEKTHKKSQAVKFDDANEKIIEKVLENKQMSNAKRLNDEINELVNNITHQNIPQNNITPDENCNNLSSTTKSNKDEMIDRVNKINDIFENENKEELEDITITTTL